MPGPGKDPEATREKYASFYRVRADKLKKIASEYNARIETAGLIPLDCSHYKDYDYSPKSDEAWELHRLLLESENALDIAALDEIKHGKAHLLIDQAGISIRERVNQGVLLSFISSWNHTDEFLLDPKLLNTQMGENIIRWVAIGELGLSADPYYSRDRESAEIAKYRLDRDRKSK